MPPILDRVTEQCPPKDVPPEDVPPEEEESFGGTIKRHIMDILPEDVVEGGKSAFDVMGKLGFADFQTGLDRLMDAWSDDGPDVGARLRQSYEDVGRGFKEHKQAVGARREEEEPAAAAEAGSSEYTDFNTKRTAAGLRAMTDLGINHIEQDILDWRESPIRQQYLDAIAAERQRRDE